MTRYLVVQEIFSPGGLSDERLAKLMDALLDTEKADEAIVDPDLAAALSTGDLNVQMTVEASDPAEALAKAMAAVRAAIHVIGDATPGWETAQGVMRIAPASASERLFADA